MCARPVRELQLATLVDAVPEGDLWLHEQKYDGYRILAELDGDHVRLLSRRFLDWTAKFPAIAHAIRKLPARRAVLDGEVCVVLPDGRTSFQALQQWFATPNPNLVYFAFDLLALDDEDLRSLPLETRKQRLNQLIANPTVVRCSEHMIGNGAALFRAACDRGIEGIVSKRRDRPYEPGRGTSWVKTKCTSRQELVIGGFTESSGAARRAFAGARRAPNDGARRAPNGAGRDGFGALLVGYYEADRLVYAGKVGTGFTMKVLDALGRELASLERPTSPFEPPPRGFRSGVHWVTPMLVAEIEFGEWTAAGRLRHPSFLGLRRDKDPRSVVRERPKSGPRAASTR